MDATPTDRIPEPTASRIAFDPYVLEIDEARLTRDGTPIDLPPRAFALLSHLARQAGRLVRKDDLLDAVWGHRHVSESVLKTVVSQIRTMTGDDPRAPRIIETVPRRGYRFVAPLSAQPLPGRPGPFAIAPSDDLEAAGAQRPGRTPPALPAPSTIPPTALPAIPQALSPLPLPLPRLVGRQSALDALAAGWTAAAAGRARLILVAGEPGIGKSTLLEHFLAGCPPQSIATGQCVDRYGSGEPYAPLLEALDMLIRHEPALIELLRAVAPTWLMQLPWHLDETRRAALAREIAGATQDRMMREFGMLLERASQRRPLLIVIEDLHWSDDATVHLLDFLARRRGPARLLILGSFRPADVIATGHAFGRLRRELRLHRLCDEILLDGFTRAEVAEYLEDRLASHRPAGEAGVADMAELTDMADLTDLTDKAEMADGHGPTGCRIDPATVTALHRHTDGLPLFVASVIDELLDQGLIQARRDGSDARARPAIGVDPDIAQTLPVPDNLVGVIEHQLLRLADGDRALLQAAALIGAEFDHLLLAEAVAADPAVVQAAFDTLAERRLWLRTTAVATLADGRMTQGYAFRHALHRHVLDAAVGPAARARLHRGIAHALPRLQGARTPEYAAELALHCERGHEPSEAAGWYLQAARNARQRLAQAEALALVDRGLRLLDPLPPGPARAAELPLLSLRIAGQMTTFGQGLAAAAVSSRRALALIDRLPLTSAIAPLWHAVWWVHARGGDWAAAREVNARMAARIDDPARPDYPGAACLAQRGILELHHGHHVAAIDALEAALAQLAVLPTSPAPVFVQDLAIECLAHLSLGRELAGRLAAAADARRALQARIDAGTDPLSETTGLWFIAFQHLLRADLAALGRIEVRAMAGIEGRDALSGTGPHRVVRGWFGVMTATTEADRDAALALCEDGTRVYAEHGARSGMPVMHRLLAEARIRCGRLAEAADALRRAAEEREAIGENANRAEQYRIEALLLAAEGQPPARVEQCFVAALAAARDEGSPMLALVAAVARARWTRSAGGDPAAARQALEDALAGLEPDPTLPLRREALAWLGF